MKINKITYLLMACGAALYLAACSPASGNHPGSEYMPDMGHSVAVEANVVTDYQFNTFEKQSAISLREITLDYNKPVEGTIPRGYAGIHLASEDAEAQAMEDILKGNSSINGIAVPVNGSVPYYYKDTDEDRLRAEQEMIMNPYPITAKGLEQGKELYNTFCGICHGEKGDGAGYLARDGSPYQAAPSNYLTDEFVAAKNGRYYHAIMYGKNVMGAYKDKLSYEERWNVIHYIRALQAKDKKMAYNEKENTFLPEAGEPAMVLSLGENFNPNTDAFVQKATNALSSGENTEALILENIEFATGSAYLKSSSKKELDKLVYVLSDNEGVNLVLEGHTDNTGDLAKNFVLSRKRASAVKSYLIGKGIATDRISATGYGAMKAKFDNETEEGRAKNRRVEFSLIK